MENQRKTKVFSVLFPRCFYVFPRFFLGFSRCFLGFPMFFHGFSPETPSYMSPLGAFAGARFMQAPVLFFRLLGAFGGRWWVSRVPAAEKANSISCISCTTSCLYSDGSDLVILDPQSS